MHIPYKNIGTLPELSSILPFKSPPTQIQSKLCMGGKSGVSGRANVPHHLPLLTTKSSDIYDAFKKNSIACSCN